MPVVCPKPLGAFFAFHVRFAHHVAERGIVREKLKHWSRVTFGFELFERADKKLSHIMMAVRLGLVCLHFLASRLVYIERLLAHATKAASVPAFPGRASANYYI